MSALLRWLDRHTNLMRVLLIFWSCFWLLNGADKFFNGKHQPNLAKYAASSAILDQHGQHVLTVHPVEPTGVFGVTRDNKMAGYFARIGLPRSAALGCLYGFAVVELLLGLGFGAVAVHSLLGQRARTCTSGLWGLFSDRTLHRLCFKGSIAVFLAFSVGDILFGDRIELWEHGTFMVMTLVTYDMWYRTDQFVADRERAESAAERRA